MLRMTRARWWLLLGLLLSMPFAQARSHHHADAAAVATISIAELPPEARETLQLIRNNGPFPYPRDGVVFGNYGHSLPPQKRGYYHEYTVKTPGAHNRGARRIVCGIAPECYYTNDHYQSFRRIKE